MTTNYNKYYDTYIKQKTTGAIAVNSKNYSLRNDGNTYLKGDIDISGNLSINGSDVQTQINSKMTSSNYLQVVSNGTNGYINIGNQQSNNKVLVIYDASPSDNPVDATYFYGFGINSGIRFQVPSISESYTFNAGYTQYVTINNNGITINTGNLNGCSLTNLPNLVYLDCSGSLTTLLSNKQNLLNSSSALLGATLNGTSLTNITKLPYLDCSGSLTTLLSNKQNLLNSSSALLGATLNGTSLTNITKLPYLDCSGSLTTLLSNKQNLLNSSSALLGATLNGISLTNITNLPYYDCSGSLTTLLSNKQNLLNSSSALLGASLNGVSLTNITNLPYYDCSGSLTTLLSNKQNLLNSSSALLGATLNGISLTNITNLPYYDCSGSLTTLLGAKTTLSAVQSNNNAFTGTNTFNTSLPTSNLIPSLSSQFITKLYADSTYTASGGTTLSAVQSNNNVWTGTNAFNTSLPTTTLSPTLSTQLISKSYCDTQIATCQPSITSTVDIYGKNISGNIVEVRTSLYAYGVTIPNTRISNLQYLDINSSLTTQLASKQPTIDATVDVYGKNVSGDSINVRNYLTTNGVNIPASVLSNLQCMNILNSSSLTTTTLNIQEQIQQAAFAFTGANTFLQAPLYLGTDTNPPSNTFITRSYVDTQLTNKMTSSDYLQVVSNGTNGYVNIGNQQSNNKVLVIYDASPSDNPVDATYFYGFGISSGIRYQTPSTSESHGFYGGYTQYVSIGNNGITMNTGDLSIPAGAAFTFIPPGTIMMGIAGSMSGYLLCNGQTISRATYANLFAVLGTAYGAGNGTTTFKIPDFRGMFLRGTGTHGVYTNRSGPSLGAVQMDQIASHTHSLSNAQPNYQYGNNSGNFGVLTGGTKAVTTTGNYTSFPGTTNATGGTETNPINYSVNYFVKY
jgi:microcystin-dependent protein